MAMVAASSRGGKLEAAGGGGGEWKEKEKEKELCLQLQKASKAWSTELRNAHLLPERKKVAVVYYLSRNGHLEHPHFMEVPLSSSSSDGLYLKDVISRLSALRGRGLAGLYSWAAKRSYRNGYVWHDLTEEDFIHPVHGNEYVLKGTELLNLGPVSCSETSVGTSSSTSSTGKILETSKSSRDDSEFSASSMKSQKKSWGPLELKEYNLYRAELMESGDKNNSSNVSNGQSADVSTQTDDQRGYRRRETAYPPSNLTVENNTVELNTGDDISPPPTSSPETLEALVKHNRRILEDRHLMMVPDNMRGKTSAVLMHLISCGSIAVKGQGVMVPPPPQGARLTTRERRNEIGGSCRLSERGKVVVVEKECFSGSLLESSKEDDDAAEIAAVLKKCSSFTAERGMKKKLESPKEVEGVLHSRCMPRNSKPRKLEGCNISSSSYLPPVSRSTRGSKRFTT